MNKPLSVIYTKFEEAKILFTEIYDEYTNSDEFKLWMQSVALETPAMDSKRFNPSWYKRIPDSQSKNHFSFKLKLLRAYLGIDGYSSFPEDWYTNDYVKSWMWL